MSSSPASTAPPGALAGPAVAPSRRHARLCRRVLSLNDFEPLARAHLPRPLFAYVSGAVEDNRSLDENRRAFDDWTFVTRILTDVSTVDTSFELFGRRYSAPIGLAPMGISALSAYRGDIVLAQSAQAENVPAIMSGSSLIRLEDVMAAAPDTWFQAYLPGDQEEIDRLLDRVVAARVRTLVVTVDTPVAANRENNLRAGFSTPLRPSLSLAWQGITHPRWTFGTFLKTLRRHGMPHFENNFARRGAPILSAGVLRDFAGRGHLTWTHFAAIRKRWVGPLVLKGLLAPEDAKIARDHGADGLIVSNHGGRQLDGAIAPLRALPAVIDAVPGVPVMIDSGVRRGTDAIKAIALGARCVWIGRPFNYAAAVASASGVRHGIMLMRSEISRDMAMLGITQLDGIGRACLRPNRSAPRFHPEQETRTT